MNQFVFGISSAAAVLFSCPFDAFKTVLQTRSELTPKQRPQYLATMKQLIGQKGTMGLYAGLRHSMLRHFVFTEVNVRMMNDFKQRDEEFKFQSQYSYAIVSCSAATALSNPMDVLLVRKQVSLLDSQKPKGYSVLQDISCLNNQQGLRGLTRGLSANLIKINLIIATQLSYHHYAMQDGRRNLTFGNLLVMVALGSTLAIPFDNLKIKMQKSLQRNQGLRECLKQTLKSEGLRGLVVRWPVYLVRNVVHTFMSIMVGSQLKSSQKTVNQQ